MTDECISPLRRRMIEDMTVRNFGAEDADTTTFGAVKNFAVLLGAIAGHRDPKRTCGFSSCIWHRAASARQPSTARFGAAVLLQRNARSARHRQASDVRARSRAKMPVVLSPEEVARLLEAAPGVKYKAALSVAYGAGLRVSEVVCAEGVRHRQRAHDDARRARQGPQGSLRDAVAACCSSCCAIGGASRARRAGCSRARIRCSR